MTEGKVCKLCGKLKSLNAYRKSNDGISSQSMCMTCYSVRDRLTRKRKFLEIYGGICICCGESDIRFLCLDHIKNDGGKHREQFSTTQIMMAAIKGYRPDLYQILCYNCNFGKNGNDGICPHKSMSLAEYLDWVDSVIGSKRKLDLAVGPVRTRYYRMPPEKKVEFLMEKLSPEEFTALLARYSKS